MAIRRTIPSPDIPVIDPKTGAMNPDWYDFFQDRTRTALADLPDVNTSGATNGQVLTFDSSSNSWKPTTIAFALNDLTDVDTTGVQVGYTIKFIPAGFWLATAP
jgi:hypothetical protein